MLSARTSYTDVGCRCVHDMGAFASLYWHLHLYVLWDMEHTLLDGRATQSFLLHPVLVKTKQNSSSYLEKNKTKLEQNNRKTSCLHFKSHLCRHILFERNHSCNQTNVLNTGENRYWGISCVLHCIIWFLNPLTFQYDIYLWSLDCSLEQEVLLS